MSDRAYGKVLAQQKTLTGSSFNNQLLQRTCACGQHTISGGECSTCHNERSTSLHSHRAFSSSVASTPTQDNASPVSSDSDGAYFGHDFSQIPVSSSRPSMLQTKLTGHQLAPMTIPPIVHSVLNSPSQPLDTDTRTFMEPRFRHDFSQVRLHTDGNAAASAQAINALAYTVGRDVVFGRGQYAPQTMAGRSLMAHELTHVVQQKLSGNNRTQQKLAINSPNDTTEIEAEHAATAITSGTSKISASFTPSLPFIQRACGPTIGTPVSCTPKDHGKFLDGFPIVKFKIECDEFAPGEDKALLSFAQLLPTAVTMEIHGFASVDGPPTFNENLACSRALATQSLLTSGAGIASPRITDIINHGPTPGPAAERRSVVIRTSVSLSQLTDLLAKDLQTLIDGATWKEIRKRVYPKESAAGIQRAKDRKAGKLPDLTGLGRISTLDHFAQAVHSIQARWASLSSPDDRVKEIGKAANVELTAAEVPEFLVVDKESMEFKGFFRPSDWKFVISTALVNTSSLSNDDAAEVANTTLHESRHAEQNFLAARFSAGVNNKNSAAIVIEQGIPKVIADKAVAKKMDATTDPTVAALGKEMYQANVTDAAKNQAISNDDGLEDLAKIRKEAEIALHNLKARATMQTIAAALTKRDALRRQITVVEQKYTLYRNIPYEADAHEVGDAAEQAFKGWP